MNLSEKEYKKGEIQIAVNHSSSEQQTALNVNSF